MSESEANVITIEPEEGEQVGISAFERLVGPEALRTEPVVVKNERDGKILPYRFTGHDKPGADPTGDGQYGTIIDLGDGKYVVMSIVSAIGAESPQKAVVLKDGNVVREYNFEKRTGAAMYHQDWEYTTDSDTKVRTAGEGQSFDLKLGRALLGEYPSVGNGRVYSSLVSEIRDALN